MGSNMPALHNVLCTQNALKNNTSESRGPVWPEDLRGLQQSISSA